MSRSNYNKPFYVDVGTSIVAIRCASNHDVIVRYDHVRKPFTLDLAKDICNRMNSEAKVVGQTRNCDVGTVEEQAERFDEFCYNHRSREKGCGDCPLLDGGPCCELAWAQMPYEEVIATISQPHRVARRNAENTEAKDPTHGAVRKG